MAEGAVVGDSPRKRRLLLRFGDASQTQSEVAVPMPRSLAELLHVACQTFGRGGVLRLFHQGNSLLYHATQIKQLNDGDLVVVRRLESHRPVTPAGSTTNYRQSSVHQADYHKHPLLTKIAPNGADYQTCLAERSKGASLENMSRYASDFVVHPYAARDAVNPTSALVLHTEGTASSTYSREYSWRDHAATHMVRDDKAVRESSLFLSSHSRFDGSTNYNDDFARRDMSAREPVVAPLLQASSIQPPPAPFSARSTYSANYVTLSPGRQPSARPKVADYTKKPFLGTSEYRGEYHQEALIDRDC